MVITDTECWNAYRESCADLGVDAWRHSRPGGHMRWDRAFVHTFGTEWKCMARDPDAWRKAKGEFIAKAYQFLNVRELEDSYAERAVSKDLQKPPSKPQRVFNKLGLQWDPLPGPMAIRLAVLGDNQTVIKWMQGRWQA
eukprot:11968062-Karenia_brevis.AAC.1